MEIISVPCAGDQGESSGSIECTSDYDDRGFAAYCSEPDKTRELRNNNKRRSDMNIYIIRHGETDWNAQRKLQGQADVPLNEKGRRLAALTAEAMKDISFAEAYSSPLVRAMETAKTILGSRDIPIIQDNRLMEISFGSFEGEEMKPENPRLQGNGFMNFFTAPDQYIAPTGGETFLQVCERTTQFLEELAARRDLEGKNVLVASHGAAIKGMLSSLYLTDISDFWHGGVHKNCAVSLIRVRDGQMTLVEDGKIAYKDE